MRKPGGYAVWTNADGVTKECDTITCAHCNSVQFVQPKQDPSELGGFCFGCYRAICGPCADLGVCTPIEKRLEQMEGKRRFSQALGLK